jgi:hypothetical protein
MEKRVRVEILREPPTEEEKNDLSIFGDPAIVDKYLNDAIGIALDHIENGIWEKFSKAEGFNSSSLFLLDKKAFKTMLLSSLDYCSERQNAVETITASFLVLAELFTDNDSGTVYERTNNMFKLIQLHVFSDLGNYSKIIEKNIYDAFINSVDSSGNASQRLAYSCAFIARLALKNDSFWVKKKIAPNRDRRSGFSRPTTSQNMSYDVPNIKQLISIIGKFIRQNEQRKDDRRPKYSPELVDGITLRRVSFEIERLEDKKKKSEIDEVKNKYDGEVLRRTRIKQKLEIFIETAKYLLSNPDYLNNVGTIVISIFHALKNSCSSTQVEKTLKDILPQGKATEDKVSQKLQMIIDAKLENIKTSILELNSKIHSSGNNLEFGTIELQLFNNVMINSLKIEGRNVSDIKGEIDNIIAIRLELRNRSSSESRYLTFILKMIEVKANPEGFLGDERSITNDDIYKFYNAIDHLIAETKTGIFYINRTGDNSDIDSKSKGVISFEINSHSFRPFHRENLFDIENSKRMLPENVREYMLGYYENNPVAYYTNTMYIVCSNNVIEKRIPIIPAKYFFNFINAISLSPLSGSNLFPDVETWKYLYHEYEKAKHNYQNLRLAMIKKYGQRYSDNDWNTVINRLINDISDSNTPSTITLLIKDLAANLNAIYEKIDESFIAEALKTHLINKFYLQYEGEMNSHSHLALLDCSQQ